MNSDPILSQPNTLAEMEREVCLKQNQKSLTNIHDIYNSNKPKTSEIEVSYNEYCIL